MAPLLTAGLTLLPKIPDLWSVVAGLFGKKVPSSVREAGNLATNVLDAFRMEQVPPEVQVELEKELNRHKEKIQEFALKEIELQYENVNNMIELEKESYKSDDQYVRRTRPMILRKLFYSCIGFSFFAPTSIIIISKLSIDGELVITFIDIVKYIGTWLFGTFSTAFLGYAASRTIDKRNPNFKEGNGITSKITKGFLKIGQ